MVNTRVCKELKRSESVSNKELEEGSRYSRGNATFFCMTEIGLGKYRSSEDN